MLILYFILGTHKETYYTTETYYENKVRRERYVEKTRDIIDFAKEFDLTSFISPKGKIHNPDKYINLEQELEEEIENYINSEAKLKELKIIKKVNWDYDKLNQKIKKLIKMSGYPHTVTIDYRLNRKQIRVRSNNLVNTCINNPFYIAFNIVSCLFIVTWPLSMIYKKEYGNQLVSTFEMDISVNTWLTENLEYIKDIIYEV
ncbi:hypothetical protein K502DRAFT_326222 [Neoconidiobolus thromboides FSU 785]|nr:hypothetical protein K502DRAFT_326222 [Neoconidiobolus thromboides FSU 785]